MRPIFPAIALVSIICGQVPPSRQPRLLVLAHVNVVDVTSGSVRRDYNVTIAGDRIAALQASTQVRGPADAQVIDARGKYLIPGLVDMHVHGSDERFLNLFVANGVTSVRLMWGMPLHLNWRKRIDSGELLGPRLSIASPLVDGPNPVWPGSTVVADAHSAKDTVGQIERGGYDFVKIYNRLPREAYFALLNEAKAQGLAVAGHVPLTLSTAEAADAGQKSIEHLTGILLAASSQEGQLRQQSLSALTGGEAGKGIDSKTRRILREINARLLATYDPSKAAWLFARLQKNGTWQCPTLTVLRSIASLDDPTFVGKPTFVFLFRSSVESPLSQSAGLDGCFRTGRGRNCHVIYRGTSQLQLLGSDWITTNCPMALGYRLATRRGMPPKSIEMAAESPSHLNARGPGISSAFDVTHVRRQAICLGVEKH